MSTNPTSLIAEYRKRHGLNCVLSVDEGVTFFEAGSKPAAIVLTSSHSRSIASCRECLRTQSGIIGELFVHTGRHFPEQVPRLIRHEHLPPDADLCSWANQHAGLDAALEPFIAPSTRQVECWLWRFYTRSHPSFLRKWKNKDEPFRSLEQISWAIDNSKSKQKHLSVFEAFYTDIYYTFKLGRRYTIFG